MQKPQSTDAVGAFDDELDERDPNAVEVEPGPVPVTTSLDPEGLVRPKGAARLLGTYRPRRWRDPLAARIRRLPDPSADRPSPADTETELAAQPIVVDHLPGPVRQRVLEALAGRSRALATVSVRRSLLAGGLVMVVGDLLVLGLLWSCLERMSPTFLTDPTNQVALPIILGALSPPVAGVAVYGICRLVHHRAIRMNRRLGAAVIGLLASLVLAGAFLGILRPWSFPKPSTRPVPFSTIEQALSANRYRVIAFGLSPTRTAGTTNAVYLEDPGGTWLVAPQPQPLPLLVALDLGHARLAGAPTLASAVAGRQLGALSQRSDLLAGLLVFNALAAAALTVVQLWRWRSPPAARVPEATLRRLVTSLQTTGGLPAGWMVNEPAFGERWLSRADLG